jgi:hypothetical protein
MGMGVMRADEEDGSGARESGIGFSDEADAFICVFSQNIEQAHLSAAMD